MHAFTFFRHIDGDHKLIQPYRFVIRGIEGLMVFQDL